MLQEADGYLDCTVESVRAMNAKCDPGEEERRTLFNGPNTALTGANTTPEYTRI